MPIVTTIFEHFHHLTKKSLSPLAITPNLPTVKKKQQAQNGVTCAKSHQDLIPNLIAVTTSRRSVTFTESTWNYLVSAEVFGQQALPFSLRE